VLKKRESALKKKIESVSEDYQLQKISADDASRKILGYEKELYGVRERMEKALLRLKK